MSAMRSFIDALPKAELHMHIEGAIQPETKLRLAGRNGIALAQQNADEIRASYDFTDLSGFLAAFNGGVATLIEELDFYEVTWEYLERCHSQNVLHAELHFDPQLHVSRGVKFDTFMRGIRRAQVAAEQEMGITSVLIMALYRELEGLTAQAMFEASHPFQDWITAVGFYPFSVDGWTPPEAFGGLAQSSRARGHKITVHCNNRQPQSLETIRQCVRVLRVDRLDHGVDVVEDDGLIEEIKAGGLCFTVCPTESLNRPGPRFAREFRIMMDRGLRVTANSDDPGYFLDRYLPEILEELQKKIDLKRADLVQLARNAFEASWLSEDRKRGHLAKLDAVIVE